MEIFAFVSSFLLNLPDLGNFLPVQCWGMGLIPGGETKILQASLHGHKKKRERNLQDFEPQGFLGMYVCVWFHYSYVNL